MRCKGLTPRFVFGLLVIVFALSSTLWIGCGESDTPSGPETIQETIIPSAPAQMLPAVQAAMQVQNRHTNRLRDSDRMAHHRFLS